MSDEESSSGPRCVGCGGPRRPEGEDCPGCVRRRADFYRGRAYSLEDVERWTEGDDDPPI